MAQDAIDDFIALPQDQQLATLQGLPRTNQDRLLEKVKQRRANTGPLPEGVKQVGTNSAGGRMIAPEGVSTWDVFKDSISNPENWSQAGASAWNELKSVPQGIGSLFAAPKPDENIVTATPAARLIKSELESRKKLIEQASGQFRGGHPVLGTASTILAGLPLPGVPGMAAGINESMESGDTAGGLGKGLADVGMLAVPDAAVKGARKLPAILRPTVQRLVGAGERPVKAEVAKAADAANDARTATLDKNRAADEKTLKARGEVDAANSETLVKHQADVRAVRADNVKNLQNHLAAVDEAVKDKKAGPAILDAREGLQHAVDDATKDVDVRTEKARHDALVEGNDRFNTVNEELNPLKASPNFLSNSLLNASEKIKGSNTSIPILNDIERRVKEGSAPTYETLQGYYSELGREIVKGTLPGDVYHALDTLHEEIGGEMQRIADSQGMGGELKSAREYWRRMKQTFGDTSDAVSDRAAKEVKEANPEANKGQVSEYRRRLLASFDPQIPKLLEQIDKGTQRLKDLPTEDKARALAATKVPEPPAMKPQPKLPEPASYAEPHATAPIEVPGVDTRAIRSQLFNRWISGEEKLDKYQVKRVLGGGLGAIAGQLFGGAHGWEMGGIAGAAFGPTVIVKLLDTPAFREWITKPPAGELETLSKLPNADRIKLTDGLRQVVSQAQKRGIKVSPTLITLVGRSAVTPPALRKSPLDEQ